MVVVVVVVSHIPANHIRIICKLPTHMISGYALNDRTLNPSMQCNFYLLSYKYSTHPVIIIMRLLC